MVRCDSKYRRMMEDPPARLVIRHSLPTVLSAVLPAVSSMADAFFLSRLGMEACGAVGVVFPMIAAIQTVGFVFGTGAGSLLSRALGARERDAADEVASASLLAAVLLAVLFGTLGLIFQVPLLRLFGASESLLPLARRYAVCLLLSAPLMCASFVLSNLLRAEGHTVWSMIGMSVGNILCIALDPLLIFRFGLGVLGAGIAVPVGYASALIILLAAYLLRKSEVSIRPRFSMISLRAVGRILPNGLPSLFRQGLTVFAAIFLNRAARTQGDAAIAALAVVTRFFLLLYGFSLGIGQGMIPAAGYNYGSGNLRRTRSIYLFSVFFACSVALLLAVPTAILAPRIIALFRPDKDVISVGAFMLRTLCFVLPLHGFIAVTNIGLQGLGKPFGASLIASARQGIFFFPLVFLLPKRFGPIGLSITQPIADGLTFLLTLPFAIRLLRELSQNTKEHPA